MQNAENKMVFKIDGYEVSATFAEAGNPSALGHVKQILLSSFAANGHKAATKGILDVPSGQRYNINRGKS